LNADAATQLIFKALQIGPHHTSPRLLLYPPLDLSFPSTRLRDKSATAASHFFPSSPPVVVVFLHETQPATRMGGFDKQVKERTKELKHLKDKAMRGIKVASESCKKAWSKVRSSIKR